MGKFLSSIFGKDSSDQEPRLHESVSRMLVEIDRLGGLHFVVSLHTDEWVAECENADGIISGGAMPVSLKEIDSSIKDAIFTAFRVPAEYCDENLLQGPSDLGNEPTIDRLPSFTYTGHRYAQ